MQRSLSFLFLWVLIFPTVMVKSQARMRVSPSSPVDTAVLTVLAALVSIARVVLAEVVGVALIHPYIALYLPRRARSSLLPVRTSISIPLPPLLLRLRVHSYNFLLLFQSDYPSMMVLYDGQIGIVAPTSPGAYRAIRSFANMGFRRVDGPLRMCSKGRRCVDCAVGSGVISCLRMGLTL